MMLKRTAALVVPVLALTFRAAQGAPVNFVQNGGFDTTTKVNYQLGYSGTTVADWTTVKTSTGSYTPYTFIYASGAADTTGATGVDGNVALWGPGGGTSSPNYSNNNMPAASPNGGNYLASDPNYLPGSIEQTITGLTSGQAYEVSFYWAGAQQSGHTGDTTQWWQVSLGSQSFTTAHASVASKGFAPWTLASFTFTATGSTEVLSFLAHGTPTIVALPPFLLLDGVSMNAVPEPSSVVLIGSGVIGLCIIGARRRRASASA